VLAAAAVIAATCLPAGMQPVAAATPKLKLGANSRLAPGVYYRSVKFTNGSGAQRAYVVSADLTVPGVSFVPATSTTTPGRVGRTQNVTTTVTQQKAVAGINADQFDPLTGIPLGGIMTSSSLLKTPFLVRRASTVYVLPDGTVHVGTLTFKGSVTLVSPSATPPYDNPSPSPSSGSTATPSPTDSSSPTPTDSTTSLTFPLTSVNTPADANAGKLTMFTSSLTSVKLNKCVTATGSWSAATSTLTIWGLWGKSTTHGQLASTDRTIAGCGAAGTWLSTNLKLGSQLSISYSLTSPSGTPVQMISSAGLIVKAGAGYSDPAAITTFGLNPESALCVSQDGRQVKLVAVDGRQGKKAPGVTIPQLRDLLLSLKCYTGVVLDGGGSTSLAVKPSGKATRLVNTPSGSGKERRVPDVILIKYAKPGAAKKAAAKKAAAKKAAAKKR
jgi:exopolysaccharide biosynthesis protein